MGRRAIRFLSWWRRSGTLLRLSALACGALLFGTLLLLQRPRSEMEYPGSNLIVFVFINLVVLALITLAYVVGRNVVKLVFERRQGILGSKLRVKLVGAFVSLILVPTVLLFLVSSGLLSTAMEGWFNGPTDTAVSGAIDVARAHFAQLRENVAGSVEKIAGIVEGRTLPFSASIRERLEKERESHGLYSIQIINEKGEPLEKILSPMSDIESFGEPSPNKEAIEKALKGVTTILNEEQGARYFQRGYRPIRIENSQAVLMVGFRVDPEVVDAIERIKESKRENDQLKYYKGPLRSGYILALVLVTGVILFSAIWFGLYLARAITGPVQKLAEGTEAVARGNYNFEIKVRSDDEIGFLVGRFNQMTADLRKASTDAERRRSFIEAILGNLAVGVVALDTNGYVTSVNEAAIRVLGLPTEGEVLLGKKLYDIFPSEITDVLHPVAEELSSSAVSQEDSPVVERQLKILSQGREITLVVTAGLISGEQKERRGIVFLFDDVTELVKAQHMSAWREVARRIAHEIKNPLTPIQLSAQRLEKNLGSGPEKELVNECVGTIVDHVNSIKRLANEFSQFARMPEVELRPINVNDLISESIVPFVEAHPEIVFQFIPDSRLPMIPLDREQVRRILINLFDNGIAALKEDKSSEREKVPARIIVKTHLNVRNRCAVIEVADTGPGIKGEEKSKIFEPYFTTKKGGTGLGLAIVTSIVADHHGTIRVYDHAPRGARFVVEFPLVQKGSTLRRLA